MIRTIRAELYRLSKSKGMLIFFLLIIAIFALTVVYRNDGGISLGAPLDYTGNIKVDIRQVGRNFNFYFLMIIPVFCVIVSEFNEKTWKNTISSSTSRARFYIQKFVFTLGFSIIVFLAANALFYLANRLVNGSEYSSSFGDFMKALGNQVPLMTALVSLFIFLSFLFRKGALFNAVTIVTPILYTTVSLILFEIEKTNKFAAKWLLEYEISTMFSKLALGCGNDYRNAAFLICLGVTVCSFVLGYFSFTKREI